jgi:DNA topoisomerase IA
MAKQSLVVVESAAKAKTIEKFLGRGFTVRACLGHVRDLPTSKLGVDVEHEFKPQYVIPRSARTSSSGSRTTRAAKAPFCSRLTPTAKAKQLPGIWWLR